MNPANGPDCNDVRMGPDGILQGFWNKKLAARGARSPEQQEIPAKSQQHKEKRGNGKKKT